MIVLVFLPTAVMGAVVTFLRASERSPAQEIAAEWGRADVVTMQGGTDPSGDRSEPTAGQLDQLRASLPTGSRVLAERETGDRIRRGDQRLYVQVTDVRLDDPVASGRFGRVRGRLPAASGEAVVSTMMARELELAVGDTFSLDRLRARLTVVGTVVVRTEDAKHVVYTWDRIPDHLSGQTVVSVDLPDGVGADGLPALAPEGWVLDPVYTRIEPDDDQSILVFWTYVGGGVGLVVLGTVITAAFAIGARRQLRTVGLLSASGASPATVRWCLVAQGAVTGVIGSLAGIAAGMLALRLVPVDVLTAVAGRPVEEPTGRLLELAPIVVLGTLAASIAAWLPARSASRVATLQALAGRRPLPKVPRRLPVLGALAVGAGCALLAMAVAGSRGGGSSLWAFVAVAGSVAVLLGTIATAPWVIAGLERVSAQLPGSWRLAGRSLARSRVRSSAVVGAICAVSVSLVTGATLTNSSAEASSAVPYVQDDQVAVDSATFSNDPLRPGNVPQPAPVALLRRISAIVPGARATRLPELVPIEAAPDVNVPRDASFVPVDGDDRRPGGSDTAYGTFGVATPEILDILDVPKTLRSQLELGGAISAVEPPYAARSIEFPARFDDPVGDPSMRRSTTIPLVASFDSPAASRVLPIVLVSRATAEQLGYETRAGGTTLLSLSAPATGRQRERLQLLSSDLSWERDQQSRAGSNDHIDVAVPPTKPPGTPRQVRAGVLALALLLILAVVAVGLALAAKDSEDERQVLFAVGAPPRTLRRTSALRAVLLALVAGLISVPAGLLPAAAIVAASDVGSGESVYRPDLWTVGFVLVVVPALVGLVTWAGGRLRDLLRPKRPAVFAFGD